MEEYPFIEGDRVCHIRDENLIGQITHIDRNIPHPTTCNIKWDDCEIDDIQWTNKLVLISR